MTFTQAILLLSLVLNIILMFGLVGLYFSLKDLNEKSFTASTLIDRKFADSDDRINKLFTLLNTLEFISTFSDRQSSSRNKVPLTVIKDKDDQDPSK